ncbi:uncharacterized protein BKA78DRAFT_156787 [Phyllosticta capitalensis]|uniref:uncharacterized protein n=1 Tax=Phyllosticta capitalensis TaxID=121624 RepID=UPI00312E5AE3
MPYRHGARIPGTGIAARSPPSRCCAFTRHAIEDPNLSRCFPLANKEKLHGSLTWLPLLFPGNLAELRLPGYQLACLLHST